jgi:hypothetical protein
MRVVHHRPKSVDKVTAGIVLAIAGIVVAATLAALTRKAMPSGKPETNESLTRGTNRTPRISGIMPPHHGRKTSFGRVA